MLKQKPELMSESVLRCDIYHLKNDSSTIPRPLNKSRFHSKTKLAPQLIVFG